ncbi:MAG: RNA polymerase sigma factor [Clostridia bacterium]|nr:RNA polymerase sigma factor [Clostridia bacterium]
MYYTKNKTEAEDLLHNGFIKVFHSIRQFRGKGSFEGWIRRIFTNTALEQFRKKKLILTEDHIEYDRENTNNDILSRINAKELISLIQELSPAYRMVFNLYALEGYSHKEISEELNISIGTSKSNLSRARNILQHRISLLTENEKVLRR